jgi:signal transduction histidine kinase
MTSAEFSAQCEPEGRGGWRANVAGVDCEAHAQRLDKLREAIALAIHDKTGMALCDIVIRLEGVFPEVLERFTEAQEKSAEAALLRDEAAREVRKVVADLRAEHLTMRDISALLGITPQRVAQLVNS